MSDTPHTFEQMNREIMELRERIAELESERDEFRFARHRDTAHILGRDVRIAELEAELAKQVDRDWKDRAWHEGRIAELEHESRMERDRANEYARRVAELEGALNESQCDCRTCDRDSEWQKRQDVLMERKGGGE